MDSHIYACTRLQKIYCTKKYQMCLKLGLYEFSEPRHISLSIHPLKPRSVNLAPLVMRTVKI